MAKNSTPYEVAKWMLAQLNAEDVLYQHEAAYDIEDNFGEEHVYINNAGNLAISKDVLSEFRKLSGDSIVWVRSEKMWRPREDFDESGRRQN